jgi:hypothetical protein
MTARKRALFVKTRLLGAFVLGALVITTSVYAASSVTVSLNLQRGIHNAQLRACGIKHHYTVYRRGTRVPFDGVVHPAPGHDFRVKVKVKKCSASRRFHTVFALHVRGSSSTGRFHGHLRSLRRGYFFARAYFYGIPPQSQAVARSDKQYFRITRKG